MPEILDTLVVKGAMRAEAAQNAVSLVTKAAPAQTEDLHHWRDSADAIQARMGLLGDFHAKSVFDAGSRVYSPVNPPPVVDLTNYVTLNTDQTITGLKTFRPSAAAQVALVVQGLPGQAGDLTQWRDSAGVVTASVNLGGTVTTPYIYGGNPRPYFDFTAANTVALRSQTDSGAQVLHLISGSQTAVPREMFRTDSKGAQWSIWHDARHDVPAFVLGGSSSPDQYFWRAYWGAGTAGLPANTFKSASDTAAQVVVAFKGSPVQTGDLTQWTDSAAAVLSAIKSDGRAEFRSSGGQNVAALRLVNTGAGDSSRAVTTIQSFAQDNVTETARLSAGGHWFAGGYKDHAGSIGFAMVPGNRVNLYGNMWLETPGSSLQFKSAAGAQRYIALNDNGTFDLPVVPRAPDWQSDARLVGTDTPGGGARTTIFGSGRQHVNVSNSNGFVGWGALVPLIVEHDGGFVAPETAHTGDLTQWRVGGVTRAKITAAGDLDFLVSTRGPILTSPDGLTRRRVGIDNTGALTLTAA